MPSAARIWSLLAALCVALCVAGGASAAARADLGFDGGTTTQRAQVRGALGASSFDWGVIPSRVTVHIAPGALPHSAPGEVWLDPELLDSGRFAWAVVQDEFAHQVDFFRLTDIDRQTLAAALGTKAWCHGDAPGLAHSAYGCERFTSMLVWAYWQSPDNSYRPASAKDESATMDMARFRSLVGGILAGQPLAATTPARAVAASRGALAP